MAAFPRYDARTRTPLAGVSGGLRVPEVGDPIGRALSGLGEAAGDLGQAIHTQDVVRQRAAVKAQDEADDAWWTGQAPGVTLAIADGVNKARTGLPDNGQGYAQAVGKVVDDAYVPFEEQAKTPKARELVAKAKADARVRFGEAAQTYERNAFETWRGAQADQATSKAVDAVRAAPVDMLDDIVASQVQAFGASVGDLDPIERVKRQAKFGETVAAAAYEQRVLHNAETTGKVTGGTVADAINRIIDSREGEALNPNDNGRPSKFGIRADKADGTRNGIPVKDLTRAQAFDIYEKEYAGQLGLNEVTFAQNPAYAEVLLDAAVNHGAAKAQQMADEVGGDWRKLIALRGAEYERLARENPAKYGDDLAGWKKRLDGLTRDATALEKKGPDLISLLTPPEKKAQAIEAGTRIVEATNNRRRGELSVAIDRGEAGAADIERGVQEGWIQEGSPDWVSLSKSAADAAKKAQAAAEQKARVDLALTQGVPLDPHSSDDRKAMNADFDQRAAEWKPEDWAAQSVRYARQVGMIPDALRGRITGGLRSSNPDLRLAAAKVYADLKVNAPQAVREFSDDDVRDANLLLSYARMGLTPKEATEAIALSQKMTPEDRDGRDRAFNAGLGPKGALADQFLLRAVNGDKDVQTARGFWGGGFTPPVEMAADFKTAAQLAYRRTGDMDAALHSAYDQISRAWGPSVFNGQRTFVKNAPEVVYGLPGLSADDNAKWIRRQLADQTGMHGEAKALRLIDSPLTHAGRPVYYVMKEGDGGALEAVARDGQPLYFQPDWNSSPTKKDQDAKAKKARDEEYRKAQMTRARLGAQADALLAQGTNPVARAGGQ